MTLFGIDVSSFQDGIDMAAVAADGFTFAMIKVSEGGSYRSPSWAAQHAGALAAGLVVAGYHYVTTDPPAAQAANCAAAVGDTAIPLALDWEQGGGDWNNFCAVLAAFRTAGLQVRLAYAPRWYWAAHGSPDITPTGLPLWSSEYPTTSLGEYHQQYADTPASYWDGYGGASVALLQFSDSASHVAGHIVDCSAFRGTRDQLLALLNPPAAGGGDPSAPAAPATRARTRLGEDQALYVVTPPPPSGAPKSAWPRQRISFGFDPIGGWGGRGVVKLHFAFPGGWISDALWWLRPPLSGVPGGGVGVPNAPHNPVRISLTGQQERFVGLGWELSPPELADELDIVLAAPGGVHIFTTYEH